MANGATPNPLTTARILWFALNVSTVLMLVVVLVVRAQGGVPATPEEPILLPVLGAVSLCLAVVSLVLPGRLRRQALANANLALRQEVDDRESVGAFRQSAPTINVFADPARAKRLAWASYQTAFILGMALCEASSCIGIVIGMLGFPMAQTVPFFALSWLLMLPRFPSEKAAFGMLEAIYDARFLPAKASSS
jgi:hypothetical protein